MTATNSLMQYVAEANAAQLQRAALNRGLDGTHRELGGLAAPRPRRSRVISLLRADSAIRRSQVITP